MPVRYVDCRSRCDRSGHSGASYHNPVTSGNKAEVTPQWYRPVQKVWHSGQKFGEKPTCQGWGGFLGPAYRG
jgi:hypothetical protein